MTHMVATMPVVATKEWRHQGWLSEQGSRRHITYGYRVNKTCILSFDVHFIAGDYHAEWSLFDPSGEGVHVSARFREPVNGGGNMRKAFRYIGKLHDAFYDSSLRAHTPDMLQGMAPPARPRPWVWRQLDEAKGHMGLCVTRQGDILMAVVPLERERQTSLENWGLMMAFIHVETPDAIRMALLGLYKGLRQDNARFPDYYGMHG